MKTKRRFQIALMGILSVFFFSLGWASSSGRTVVLEPTAKHPDAHGTAFIDGNHINLQARGLNPDAVYTVWFVNLKPSKSETGAGSSPYMFRTDPWGNGSYSAALNEAPFGRWSMIMVVQHPDGDPADMKTWLFGILKHKIIDHYRKNKNIVHVQGFTEDPDRMDAFFNANGGWQMRPAHWSTHPGKAHETKEPLDVSLPIRFRKSFPLHGCRPALAASPGDSVPSDGVPLLRQISPPVDHAQKNEPVRGI